MHFCNQCGNMYYVKILKQDNDSEDSNNDEALIYYCRKCGNEDTELYKNTNNLCVSKTHIIGETQDFKNIINEYTKHDPTLPRINTIDCPNRDCLTNKTKKNGVDGDGDGDGDDKNEIVKEIIYMRYDNSNMKFIYLCTTCDNVWTN